MDKCTTDGCTRIAIPEFKMCLGCYYVFEVQPAKLSYYTKRDKFTSYLIHVPKETFDKLVTESSKLTRSI